MTIQWVQNELIPFSFKVTGLSAGSHTIVIQILNPISSDTYTSLKAINVAELKK